MSGLILGWGFYFSGLAVRKAQFPVGSNDGHNVTTGLPIDVMFGSRVGFPAELRFLP